MSGDAYHITQPAENGDGAYRVMLNTLKDAKIQPEQVQYINAHGTSTEIGDKLETIAIKRAFGDHAYKLRGEFDEIHDRPSAGRSWRIGSWHYGAGIARSDPAPTANLENPDADCDLDYVPKPPAEAEVEYAMSNSFGFGGTNGALLFRRWSE